MDNLIKIILVQILQILLSFLIPEADCLCGLVVRVPGYRF
jgi:hypothetical protein